MMANRKEPEFGAGKRHTEGLRFTCCLSALDGVDDAGRADVCSAGGQSQMSEGAAQKIVW